MKSKLFHIETTDGGGSFNFFTEATDHKKALENLLNNSSDYKNIIKDNKDLIITVKAVRKK